MPAQPTEKLRVKDCKRCILVRDIDSITARIDVAPTMHNIIYEGERFFRIKGSVGRDSDGTPSQWYLGESYGQNLRAKIAARKANEHANG